MTIFLPFHKEGLSMRPPLGPPAVELSSASPCPLSPAAWCSCPRPRGRIVPGDRGVPRAPQDEALSRHPAIARRTIGGHASRRRKGVRHCVSVWLRIIFFLYIVCIRHL